jgi:predicted ABC-type transport system involved in lysophospholipase L1 biosynthesis ATPase subunit
MNIVECVDVNKAYQQGRVTVQALKDVSLQIEKGAFLAVAGPSGSGKTTLLNMIGGLDRIDSGRILVDSEVFETMSQSQLANLRLHKIGFVFQAYNLIPVLSAIENVEYVMLLQGLPTHERRQKARAKPYWMMWVWRENITVVRRNYPEASNSASLWPERSFPIRRLSWPMNPPPTWIQKPVKDCWK